jgi:hypothetical protein
MLILQHCICVRIWGLGFGCLAPFSTLFQRVLKNDSQVLKKFRNTFLECSLCTVFISCMNWCTLLNELMYTIKWIYVLHICRKWQIIDNRETNNIWKKCISVLKYWLKISITKWIIEHDIQFQCWIIILNSVINLEIFIKIQLPIN